MKTTREPQAQGVRVFSVGDNKCVWTMAGVMHCRTCDNGFDCTSCPFDKEISKLAAQFPTARISWKEVMRQPNLHKECRHMLTGRVLFKLCSHNYECKDCAYDQQLYEYDQLLAAEARPALGATQVRSPALPWPALNWNRCFKQGYRINN